MGELMSCEGKWEKLSTNTLHTQTSYTQQSCYTSTTEYKQTFQAVKNKNNIKYWDNGSEIN